MPGSTLAAEPVSAVMLEQVSVTLGRRPVLQRLDLQIPAGQKVAVIGSSGAGKTTLLRSLTGVIRPCSGRLTVLGQSPSELQGRALRQWRWRIGVLHQDENLIPQLRVVHNVLMSRLGEWSLVRSLWSLLWPQQLEQARQALAAVELADRLWSLPGELSGGQQQRVAIARLMLQGPELMLADEPVSQLDRRLGRDLMGRLTGLADSSAATLVVNLHSLELLGEGFDRVLALRDGRVFWDGRPEDLDESLLRALYGTEYATVAAD